MHLVGCRCRTYDLFGDPATGTRAARGYAAQRWLRPLLMPDDPENL